MTSGAERVETSRAPITDAIQFLRSHGMVVEYDTPPERLLMMADFLSESGRDEAAKVFRMYSCSVDYILLVSSLEPFHVFEFKTYPVVSFSGMDWMSPSLWSAEA